MTDFKFYTERIGVFETNSSSTHSIAIFTDETQLLTNYNIVDEFIPYIEEYYESDGQRNQFLDKLGYVLVALRYVSNGKDSLFEDNLNKLKDLIKEHTGIPLIVDEDTLLAMESSYIESATAVCELLAEFLNNDNIELMKYFLFSDKSFFSMSRDG